MSIHEERGRQFWKLFVGDPIFCHLLCGWEFGDFKGEELPCAKGANSTARDSSGFFFGLSMLPNPQQ